MYTWVSTWLTALASCATVEFRSCNLSRRGARWLVKHDTGSGRGLYRKRAEKRPKLRTEKERRVFDSDIRRRDKHLANQDWNVHDIAAGGGGFECVSVLCGRIVGLPGQVRCVSVRLAVRLEALQRTNLPARDANEQKSVVYKGVPGVGSKRTLENERGRHAERAAEAVYSQPNQSLEIGARLWHLKVGCQLHHGKHARRWERVVAASAIPTPPTPPTQSSLPARPHLVVLW